MALFACLHHRPRDPHHLTYVQLAAPLERPCAEADCKEHLVVWLNPEEVRDYERGCRRFYDVAFNTLTVEGSGLRVLAPLPVSQPRAGVRRYRAFSFRRRGQHEAEG